jgi:hypothetical protein
MGWGTEDWNSVFDWGSGFVDSWSNPSNMPPGGAGHHTGIQSLHYTNGSSRYGWQLAGSGSADGLFYRHVWGGGFSSWRTIAQYNVNSATGDFYATVYYDSSNTAYYMDPSGTGDSIRVAGNIVAYYSDDRLKTKFGNITNAVDKVRMLNGFYYEANETAQKLGYKPKREVGVSAQELQEVLPEVVTDAPIGHGYLTVDYERVVPLLIEAIKELSAEVEMLKAR